MAFPLFQQDVSVVEQEKIDKLMIDMDGTENKCKQLYIKFVGTFLKEPQDNNLK